MEDIKQFIRKNKNYTIIIKVINNKINNNVYNLDIKKEIIEVLVNKLRQNNISDHFSENITYYLDNIKLSKSNDSITCIQDIIIDYMYKDNLLLISKDKISVDKNTILTKLNTENSIQEKCFYFSILNSIIIIKKSKEYKNKYKNQIEILIKNEDDLDYLYDYIKDFASI
jgi:hypothetical protein